MTDCLSTKEGVMSRYRFQTQRGTIYAGWDNPLATYFLQVWATDPEAEEADADDPEPEPLLWLGCRKGEVSTVEELCQRLSPYGEMPATMKEALRNDAREATPPTPHQERVLDVLEQPREPTARRRRQG
jgi:hypothetical protein